MRVAIPSVVDHIYCNPWRFSKPLSTNAEFDKYTCYWSQISYKLYKKDTLFLINCMVIVTSFYNFKSFSYKNLMFESFYLSSFFTRILKTMHISMYICALTWRIIILSKTFLDNIIITNIKKQRTYSYWFMYKITTTYILA